MTSASELRSGKTHRDENFPVASWLIQPRHRALILAFYNFVRTADDIADHATLEAAEKLRYENWDEVIHYCRYSAMPVGRFVLDVHGESTSTWAASDAICAGLQVNNHLQDCGKDFKNLNRVYLPRDALAAAGASVEMLGLVQAPPALLQCLHVLAGKTEQLLNEGRPLASQVQDFRLGLEIAVIQSFADRIVRMLKVRDPLSQRVHLGKGGLLAFTLAAVAAETARRAAGQHPVSNSVAGA